MFSRFAATRYFGVAMFGICALGEVAIFAFLFTTGGNGDLEGTLFVAGLLNTAWIAISFIVCTWLFSLRWRQIPTHPLKAATGYSLALLPISFGLNQWSISPAPLSGGFVHSLSSIPLAIALGTAIYFVIFALLGLLLRVLSTRGRVIANAGVVGVICLPLILPLAIVWTKFTVARVKSGMQTEHAYTLPDKVWPDEVAVSPNGMISVVQGTGPIPADRMGGNDQTLYQFGPNGAKNQVLIKGKYWGLHSLVAARDGSVWVVARVPRSSDNLARDTIVRVSEAGKITRYTPSISDVGTTSLAEAPDGALWYAESQPGRLGRIAPSGHTTEYSSMRFSPSSIAFDSRGLIWFVAQFDNLIGFIGPSGKGKYLFLPHKGSWPERITRGPDGAMWFTEYHGPRIGRIDGRGKISEFSLGSGCCPQDIVAGRSGDLWFSNNGDSAVSRITLDGKITRYPIGSPFSSEDVQGLAMDRDGSLLMADTVMSNQPQGYVTRFVLNP